MLTHLELLQGGRLGRKIIPQGHVFDVGRAPDNDLALDTAALLPRHARLLLSVEGGTLVSQTCAGKTSVLRGATRLTVDDTTPSVPLAPDDLIELGCEGTDETVQLRVVFSSGEDDAQIFETRPISALSRFVPRPQEDELLATLHACDRSIFASHSFDELVTVIADAALQLVQRATHVMLVLREDLATPETPSAEYVIVLCRMRTDGGALQTDSGEKVLVRSVFRRVVKDRAAILAADAPNGSLATESFLGASIKSTLAVPLWYRDHIVGVLQLDNRAAPAMFDRKDLDALSLLASTASLSLYSCALERRLQLREQELCGENRYLRTQTQSQKSGPQIIGSHPAMSNLLDQVCRVAKTRATVLIEGETGVGKELIAHAVHQHSPRAERLFVAQNCSAIPSNLLESELFGHRRGAFTGATDDKLGLFELADNGTLFLDEVTEMPLDLQAKLLRVLQEGEVRPLGATRSKQVNVRIVAACNRNLEREVTEGRFRQDLYFRLKVFPLTVPPLRERKSDIPLLANHFFQRYTKEYRKALLGFSEGVVSKLGAYHWPGNVRELENEIQRLVIQADDSSFITLQHLSPKVCAAKTSPPDTQVTQGTLKEMVEQVERQLITIALREHGNNKTATAKALGLTREGFHKKLRLLGLQQTSA